MTGIVAGDVEITTRDTIMALCTGSSLLINGYKYRVVSELKKDQGKYDNGYRKTCHVFTLVRCEK